MPQSGREYSLHCCVTLFFAETGAQKTQIICQQAEPTKTSFLVTVRTPNLWARLRAGKKVLSNCGAPSTLRLSCNESIIIYYAMLCQKINTVAAKRRKCAKKPGQFKCPLLLKGQIWPRADNLTDPKREPPKATKKAHVYYRSNPKLLSQKVLLVNWAEKSFLSARPRPLGGHWSLFFHINIIVGVWNKRVFLRQPKN